MQGCVLIPFSPPPPAVVLLCQLNEAFAFQGKKLPANISEDAEEGEVSDEDSADEIDDDCKLMNGDVSVRWEQGGAECKNGWNTDWCALLFLTTSVCMKAEMKRGYSVPSKCFFLGGGLPFRHRLHSELTL